MNSLMSMRIRRSSLSNKKPASALQSSVLPTPVGPRNRNEPVGRLGSDRPERERRMALATAAIASCWPTTRSCSLVSIFDTFLCAAQAARGRGAVLARLLRLRFLQLLFQLGQLAVLQLGHLVEVALAGEFFDLEFELVDGLAHMRAALRLGFFGLPDFVVIGNFLLQLGDLFLNERKAFLRGLILLATHRFALDLQLDQAASKIKIEMD